MRYGIFSDIHSNLEAFNTVLAAYAQEEIDQYFCLGDVVGYGANPQECVERIRALPIITLAGNHDWAVCDLMAIDSFNPMAQEAVLWTKTQLDSNSKYFLETLQLVFKNEELTLVHDTLNEPQDFNYLTDVYSALQTFQILDTEICFVGHTHVAGIFIKYNDNEILYTDSDFIDIEKGRKYIVNVGSVGQPRDNNPELAYCIYDTEKRRVEIKRASYDIESARKKILMSGLPEFLGDRLLWGR
jgi:predicted phosphodiesterase